MKKYIVEAVGTFFLALAVSISGSPIAIGLMLMALIYIGGHVSGGHYNPAVSFGVFLRGKLVLEDLMFYWLAQIAGAVAGLWMFGIITESVFSPDSPMEFSEGWIPFGLEALMASVLVMVVLAVAYSERYRSHAISGVAIGLTLVALASTASFGLFNPALAGGALLWNLLQGGMFTGLVPVLVFVVGPLVGGALAACADGYLNDKRDQNNYL